MHVPPDDIPRKSITYARAFRWHTPQENRLCACLL